MVTTERSRADFEATFSNPKAYKMFERVRQRVAQDSPRRRGRRSFRSASNRGNRAYRQPRTTSTYRTQSRAVSNRSNPTRRASQRRGRSNNYRRRDNRKSREGSNRNSRR